MSTSAYKELQCSVVTSDYKWMSKTLVTAQQQPAVRPFYSCKVVDDSVTGTNNIQNPGQPLQGSACTGPDGLMYAVGLDAVADIRIWAGFPTGLSSSGGTILPDTIHDRDTKNHYSIQASDWIAGTFKLDVYAFGNWDNNSGSGYLSILHWYSMDKGVTWFTTQTVNNSIIPFAQVGNIWIAAGQAFQNDAGNILSTVFYITPSAYIGAFNISYQQYLGVSGTYEVARLWPRENVNTEDWILHSLDVEYIDGSFYISFAGYHTFLEAVNQNPATLNYNIYITKIVFYSNDIDTGSLTKAIWSSPAEIMSALSTSQINLNSFTLPSLYCDGSVLWVLFKGSIVQSIINDKGSTNVSVTTNYFLAKSTDFKNFTYASPVVFLDVLFNDSVYYSFFSESGSYWLAGGGQYGEFQIHNYLADVSDDIITYEAMDTQVNPSTLNISIGNQNGQWRGASPTKSGYQAIANNKKVALFQGYYNAAGQAEYIPKNIYYIDDIQQQITTNRNDFSLLGRDFYKALKVLKTKFAFNFTGIKRYTDLFDGTTLPNYQLLSGTWAETANSLYQSSSSGDTVAVFNLYTQTQANMIFAVNVQLMNPTAVAGSPIYIYAMYIDANNWLRLKIDTNPGAPDYTATPQRNVNGAIGSYSGVDFNTFSGTWLFPFLITIHSYYVYNIYVGTDIGNGETVQAFNSATVLLLNLDTYSLWTSPGTFAFGSLNRVATFKNFRHIGYDSSLNITELLQTIATKAGITDYKLPTLFEDYFFDTSIYNGTFTAPNRVMTLGASAVVMKTDIQVTDTQLEFEARVNPTSGSGFNFDFIFRNTGTSNQDENCHFNFKQHDTATIATTITLNNTHLGVIDTMGYPVTAFNFDFKQYHKFKITCIAGWILLTIDDVAVYSWLDNNVTSTPTSGYVGLRTAASSKLEVKYIISNDLYTQIETFSINPGDDLENSIETLLATIRVYFFSDLLGRLKVLRLNSTDPSTYTYQNQILTQNVDNSDKEYINEVTVVGTGVQATAQDIVSINANSIVRNEVIVDYKITVYADALARAQLELVNYNKFNNQYTPKNMLNVGSELYDVVDVVNTGDNSSNVNQTVRIYSQDNQVGGAKFAFHQSVQTGTL